METISIPDSGKRGMGSVLSFDLIDILRLFEPKVLRSRWKVSNVLACHHPTYDDQGEWDHLPDSSHVISGHELLRLAACTFQMIEGIFKGTLPDKKEWWIKIRAVNASYFVVSSGIPEVIDILGSHFRDVRLGKPK